MISSWFDLELRYRIVPDQITRNRRCVVKARLVALIVGSSLAATGLGALLPYLYTAIAQTRGLGDAVGALTFVAVALGSLAAAPIAGRLADGRHPVLVASSSRVALGAGVLLLGLAISVASTLAAAVLIGIAYAVTQPAISVLLFVVRVGLRRTAPGNFCRAIHRGQPGAGARWLRGRPDRRPLHAQRRPADLHHRRPGRTGEWTRRGARRPRRSGDLDRRRRR